MTKLRTTRLFVFGRCAVMCLLTLVSAGAVAQDAKPVEEVSLVLTPAAEPRPALVHSLWLSHREREPGNGATYYYRAILLHAQARGEPLDKAFPPETVAQWLSVPLKQLPGQEVARYLDACKNELAELQRATSREKCEWDLRLDQLQGTEVVSFLLHDFQHLRDLGRVVAIKARYEVSLGEHVQAIQSLRMGYQLARDTAEPPLLINALIGMAISAQMNQVTLDLIQSPDAPNLYWALKQLPHPLIDMRPSLEFEMAIPFRVFPYLADAETAERTPEQWQRLTQETLANLSALSSAADAKPALSDWQIRLGATALMMKAYPVAKQQLIAAGSDKAEVEKMPVAQVIAIHTARNYRYTYDEVFKWSLLPFPDSHAQMQRSLERLRQEGYIGQPFSDKDVLPIASLLMPAIETVMISSTRSERRLASLETLEALRLHAAARGELPSSLAELAVPAPKNPFSGGLFTYRREEGKAILDERAEGVDPVRAGDRIYLIELAQPLK